MNTPAGNALNPKRMYVLAMLFAVYTFNFIDRQIVSILAVPIKSDLALTDTQLGLVGGLAFALFYTALGIPVAVLADRYSRTWIMTVALALWSAMTAVCGLATSFAQLFLARLGVGVGEAGGVAPAYSLIADYFPPHQRARALSLYSLGIPFGTSLGILAGGLVTAAVDWRFAFFAVGIAGLLLAPVFRLTVSEPARGALDRGDAGPPLRIAEIFLVLRKKPSFWLLAFGAASASMMGYGVLFWLPSLLVRSFELSLVQASVFMAALTFFGGVPGIWAGGWIADRFGRRRRSVYGVIPAVAFLASVPLFGLGVFVPSPALAFAVLLPPVALSLAWLGPVVSAIQHVVRPAMRTTASAVYLFIVNLIGLGAGTVVLGWLSDTLAARFGDDSLRYAILAGTSLYVLAALLCLLAARWLPRDWED